MPMVPDKYQRQTNPIATNAVNQTKQTNPIATIAVTPPLQLSCLQSPSTQPPPCVSPEVSKVLKEGRHLAPQANQEPCLNIG